MKITKGLTWPFLALAFATTIVYMAGLAALQHSCYSIGFPGGVLNENSTPTSAFGMSDGWGNCSKVFRFYWFIFAFAIVCIIGLMITAATPLGLHFSRPFWVGMMTLCALLMMIASEAFLGFDKMYKWGFNEPAYWLAQLRTTAAGAIMSVVAFILLLLAIGTDWERTGSGTRRRDEKITGTTTTEHVAVPVGNVRVVDQV